MYTIELKSLKKKYTLLLNGTGTFVYHSSDPYHFQITPAKSVVEQACASVQLKFKFVQPCPAQVMLFVMHGDKSYTNILFTVS